MSITFEIAYFELSTALCHELVLKE